MALAERVSEAQRYAKMELKDMQDNKKRTLSFKKKEVIWECRPAGRLMSFSYHISFVFGGLSTLYRNMSIRFNAFIIIYGRGSYLCRCYRHVEIYFSKHENVQSKTIDKPN